MSAASSTVTVLALLPSEEDQASLQEIFRHSNWKLRFARTIRQAQDLIDQVAPGVVITHCRLPDGHWHDVIQGLQRRPVPQPLIVVSRLADDGLWQEVLNLGGYDVLAMPFRPAEVVRSVSVAWRYWRDQLRATHDEPPAKAVASAAGFRLAS